MPQKTEYQLKKRKRWLGNLTLPDGSAGKCIIESREEKYALMKYLCLEKRHPDCVFEKEPILQLITDPRKILREQIKPYREIFDKFYDFQTAILQEPPLYPKNKHFNRSVMWLRGFPPYKFIYKEDNSIYAIEIAAISDRNALEK